MMFAHVRCSWVALVVACFAIVMARPLRAQLAAEIHGTITDARTGHPVRDARIDILGQAEQTRSQADGAFVLRGLEPRAYTVRVRSPGYTPYTADVVAENGRPVTLDVALAAAAVVVHEMVIQGQRDTTTGAIVTFDRAAIEASGRRDVGELLRSTPGVVVTQAGGPGSTTTVSIRGSSANEVLVLVDGVPINSTITGEADLSHLSLENVERVAVLPGAQSARYGSRALAGVVAIDTRWDVSELSAMTRAGSWGEGNVGLSAGTTHPMGGALLASSLNADYRTYTGDFGYTIPAVRGGGDATRANADVTSTGVFASTALEGDDRSLGLRAGWESVARGMPGSIVQPSLDGHERDTRANATLDGQWTTGRVSWNATADVSHEATRFVDPSPPYGAAYDDTVAATGLTVNASGKLALGAGASSVGIESRTLDIHSSMLAPDAPQVQRQFGTWVDFHSSSLLLGDVSISGNASARVDWDTFLSGATASPRIGATVGYRLLSLETSLGQGYAPPSLGDQFFHEGVQVQPNPNLRPERVRNDLDARLTLSDVAVGVMQFGGSVNVYRANVDGMILWSPNFQFVWSPNNFDIRRSGWDLDGHAALPSVGASLDATVSRSNVTYTGAVMSGQVIYRPRTTANFTTAVTRDVGTLDVVTRFVGTRRTVPGSSLNTLDPYWLTDLHLSHPIVRRAWRMDLSAGIENVFDRPAAMLVDYPFPGRTWTLALRVTRGRDRHSGTSITSTP
jgi:outer membrane cobalamin receptor